MEAEEVEECVQQDIATLRRKERTLGKQVNVLDVFLEDLNIYAGIMGSQTTALGYATKCSGGGEFQSIVYRRSRFPLVCVAMND